MGPPQYQRRDRGGQPRVHRIGDYPVIEFVRVSSGDHLREWWTQVRAGLIVNEEYHGETLTPERVYQALLAGTADLFLLFEAEQYLGFIVVTVEGVGVRAEPYLYLWQVYFPGMLEGGRIAAYIAGLDTLAQERGLTRIRMNTTRKGWERAVRGFAEPVLIEYERKVPHG
jgi:hypothetical protein